MACSQMCISGLLTEDRASVPAVFVVQPRPMPRELRHFLCHFHSTSPELLDLVQEHVKADLNNKVEGFW